MRPCGACTPAAARSIVADDRGVHIGRHAVGGVEERRAGGRLGHEAVDGVAPEGEPAVEVLGGQTLELHVGLDRAAGVAAGAEDHGGPEVLHLGEVRGPVGHVGGEDGAEEGVGTDGAVERRDERADELVIGGEVRRRRGGALGQGEFAVIAGGHEGG